MKVCLWEIGASYMILWTSLYVVLPCDIPAAKKHMCSSNILLISRGVEMQFKRGQCYGHFTSRLVLGTKLLAVHALHAIFFSSKKGSKTAARVPISDVMAVEYVEAFKNRSTTSRQQQP